MNKSAHEEASVPALFQSRPFVAWQYLMHLSSLSIGNDTTSAEGPETAGWRVCDPHRYKCNRLCGRLAGTQYQRIKGKDEMQTSSRSSICSLLRRADVPGPSIISVRERLERTLRLWMGSRSNKTSTKKLTLTRLAQNLYKVFRRLGGMAASTDGGAQQPAFHEIISVTRFGE